MEKETAVIIFNIIQRAFSADLEVPLEITANELVLALNTAYDLGIDTTDIKNCYLKSENPRQFYRIGEARNGKQI